jgi:hypothetical protein
VISIALAPDMQAYHFIAAAHGLDDLRRRRLKIATLDELNDPFDLLGVNLGDQPLRHAFRVMRDELSKSHGLLCFSRDWRNPVLWSHYADRHRGLCFAFDIPDDLVGPVHYSRRRLAVDAESLRNPRQLSPNQARELLFTKFSHWRYENEVRGFVTLEDRDPETGLYFADFGEKLRLAGVIVGAQSDISRGKLGDALGNLQPTVEVFKARLAFRTFRVVRQRGAKLWV